MNNATRVSILFTLLVPLGLLAHSSDAPWVVAQGGLPGQLPGQKLPGQLPGSSSAPAKPAIAAPPSVGAALPGSPCCSITAINKATGIVTAREKSGGRTIEIKATLAQVQNLRVGEDLFANLETKQASLDGKTLCCGLTFATATPSPAFPATTLSAAPVVPAGGSPQIGSSSSAAGTAPSPQPTPSPTPSGGKGSGPSTKPTITDKGGNKNTDFPNTDTRTINASEGSTAQAIRGVTAASPPTPSAPQSPVKQLVPTKTASADPIKPGSSPMVPTQQQLPGKAPLGAPQLPGRTPEPAPSALPAKTAGGLIGVPATGIRCVSATMTSALFLKIDGIPGDSLDKCHRDEIELMGFTNSGNAITVTKRIDISTPRLFLAAVAGRVIPEAILTVLESGAQKRILRYTMKDAVVNSVDQVAGSDNRETVQFRFSSLKTETETSTATAGSSSLRSIAVSFALGSAQSAVSTLNSGASSGRFQDFVVVKPLDASSLKLMQAKQSGQVIAEIVITLKSGDDSFMYKLSNVLVASDIQQGSGSGQSETVHLQPSKVMMEHNSASRPGAAVKGGWDVKVGKKV